MASIGAKQLKRHFRQHNRWVVLLTVLTLVVAICLWACLYAFIWWLYLFFGTTVESLDFRPSTRAVESCFGVAALGLCATALIVRWLHPNAAPRDHKGFSGSFLDVVLAVPRVTLAIIGTGRAAVSLHDDELDYAWDLLRRMDEAPSPLPIQVVPQDIPDPAMRDRILQALQFSGLIEVRTSSRGPVLAFQNTEARKVARERVRLKG